MLCVKTIPSFGFNIKLTHQFFMRQPIVQNRFYSLHNKHKSAYLAIYSFHLDNLNEKIKSL